MTAQRYAVVGGGIIGAAVARRLLELRPDAQVTLLEKEDRLAAHQTGRNSGVVHAGLYYLPGSLKALLCRRGVGLLKDFCAEKGIAYDEIGKVLVALDAEEEQPARRHRRARPGQRGARASASSTRRELARARAARHRDRRPALPQHRDRRLHGDHPGARGRRAGAGGRPSAPASP